MSYDEVLQRARAWNATSEDPWPDEVLVTKVNGMFKTDLRNHPERYREKPWDGINSPEGYLLKDDGVFLIPEKDDKDPIKVSGPAWVSARARDVSS